MSELTWRLLWQVEKRPHTWAWNITTACERFTARTGLPATHCTVSPTAPPPPPGCGLVWRASVSVQPETLWISAEVGP